MSMVPTAPVKVRYSNRDFATFFDDLSKRLKDEYGDVYNDFSSASLGMMLVDLFAWNAEQLSWYTDRRATEGFLETALHRSSVSRLTRQIGYAMRPAASATVDLDVTPVAAQTFEWSVSVGFQFTGPNGLVFEATQEITWAANDGSTKTVPAREGAAKRVTSSSNGEPNQEIRLAAAGGDGKYLIQGTVRVFVDGAEWTELEFLEFEQTDTFEIHYLAEPPLVRFGNSVAGNIPNTGAEIRILFAVGSGQTGNVAAGSITGVVRPLVARFTTVSLTVNNPAPSSGGADPETTDSAKITAPKFFATRGVAVTEQDYRALSGAFLDPQYGKPSKATAYCARTLTGDVEANNLINDARGEVDAYQTTISTDAALLATELTTIQTKVDDAQAQSLTVDAKLLDIEAQVAVIGTSASLIQGRAIAIQDMITIVDDILNDNSTGYIVTLADVVTLLNGDGHTAEAFSVAVMIVNLTAALSSLITAKADIDGSATAIKSANQAIQVDVDDAQIAQAVSTADLVDVETELTIAMAQVTEISTEVEEHQVSIDVAFDGLIAHLDEVIAADCKANVITVPILASDGDGFYVAPTTGLVRRLEEYLQERADVAHSVVVVSGEFQLIEAAIRIEIRRADAYTFQEVASDADAAVRAMLKARNFGVSLYLHQIHNTLDDIPGVDIANVEILGEAAFLDSDGNLIADQEHVITYGSIEIDELL